MRVRIIPYADVAADAEEIKNRKDTSNSSLRSQRFCTGHHHLDEILPIVPQHGEFKPEVPPWAPYGYVLWQPLIARSQGMREGDSCIGRFPSFLWEDIMRCHSAWICKNHIPVPLLAEVV